MAAEAEASRLQQRDPRDRWQRARLEPDAEARRQQALAQARALAPKSR